MSLRTMPDRSKTSGPLDPSPGYGPAVSSGISPVDAAALAVPPEPAAPAVHAASATDPMPAPRYASTARRLSSVRRSKPAPWSTTSSSARARSRPS